MKSRVKKLSRRDPGTARVSPRVCFGSAPGASASASVSGQRKSFAQPSETQQPGDPPSSRSTREYALRPGRIAADAAETRATRRAPRRTDPSRTLLEGHDAKKPRLKAKCSLRFGAAGAADVLVTKGSAIRIRAPAFAGLRDFLGRANASCAARVHEGCIRRPLHSWRSVGAARRTRASLGDVTHVA